MNDETAETIAKLKELAEKATPGPWHVSHNPHGGNLGLSSACIGPHELRKFAARELTDVIKGQMAHLLPVCVVPEAWPVNEEKKGPVIDAQRNNAAWLAALAPEVILALISELEKLDREADWLAEKMAEASGSMFDDEMEDLGFECSQECEQSGCTLECRKRNWKESARKAVSEGDNA